jgi:alpha-N-arabinofuranosidase
MKNLARLTLAGAIASLAIVGHAADTGPVSVTVDAADVSATPISQHVYGQFFEHIGPIVNHGLWAEMLDDRKFYGPILDAEPPPPTDRRALIFGQERHWIRLGSPDAVTLEPADAYVGEHSPRLQASGETAVGFRQNGLWLLKGKKYDGHIVARGDRSTTLRVSVISGSNAAARQTITLPALTDEYTRYPLHFTGVVDTKDASIEITATGKGVVRIGAVSLMPADNVEGFRAEVLAALKQIDAGVYRFPGGNFVSAHEWRNAIGPRDKRPPIMDPVRGSVQPNDVGTDEFLTLSRLMNVDPYITASAGFGDAWSAAQLVEYTNGDVSTPMGKLRASNGHPEPYNVKLWGIGNEPWGDWQFGAMPVTQFVHKHENFAKAMRKVDPSITLVAGGAMPDTMTSAKQSLRFGKSLIPEPLSAADWTGYMLVHSLDYIDQVSEHFYNYAGTYFDLEKAEQVPMPQMPLVEWMRRPANHVRIKYEAWQDYLQRIPELRDRHIAINIDEWALIGLPPNSYKVVPAYAWVFHEMFRHPDVFQAAAFTFGTSMVSATRNQAELNPTGQLFKLYSRNFGKLPVAVHGNRPQPKPTFPPGGEDPLVNAGSDTYPLDVAAAWSQDRSQLTIAVINPSDSDQQLLLTVDGANLARGGKLLQLAHPDLDYAATPGQPSAVQIVERKISRLPHEITVPRYSVSMYVLNSTR